MIYSVSFVRLPWTTIVNDGTWMIASVPNGHRKPCSSLDSLIWCLERYSSVINAYGDNSQSMFINFFQKSPQFNRYCGDLLDLKPGIVSMVRHQNEIGKKIFLQRFLLTRFLAKALSVNKICHEKVSQKNLSFGVNIKLEVEALTYKIITHNMHDVRNWNVGQWVN